MISPAEPREWAQRAGVSREQVARDHLISHILAWLGALPNSRKLVFIGGTALARTHLDGVRVSEDIDLLAHNVEQLAGGIVSNLPGFVRHEYPDLSVDGPRSGPRGVVVDVRSAEVPDVQIQLLKPEPAELTLDTPTTDVSLRYRRLPPSALPPVPSPASFVAMKVAAYRDRAEPRDLFDLSRLGAAGHVTAEAVLATCRLTGAEPLVAEFAPFPRRARWMERLAHQIADPGTAAEAAHAIVDALTQATGA